MAETPLKRPREGTQMDVGQDEDCKRHRSYNHILSIFEEEDDEPNEDLSSLILTLQHELSSEGSSAECQLETIPTESSSVLEDYVLALSAVSSPLSSKGLKEDEEEDTGRVMKLLLEASDDELGIPKIKLDSHEDEALKFDSGGGEKETYVYPCDGFWELEDDAANYYTLLQFELFM